MFISMNWISDFVDLSGVDLKALIGRFTLSTAEVEDIYEFGQDISNVVVGKILSIENHPESKKLHLLKVDTGSEVVDCVCGAPNIFEGALVPFAKCGGSVKGMIMQPTKIAGYMSYGMCCSEKELGIIEDHSGVMILEGVEPGTDIKSFMKLDDVVFEVDNKSLTNRPDLWGHYGIAREIAALLKRPLKPLETVNLSDYDNLPKVDMQIETDLCFRYSCITVENVTKNVSPLNMKIRLTYCGQRPINLLADLTNYLMLELGQPMHAFDNAKVDAIRVKVFDEPVSFKTLDNTERMVEPGVMMICDKNEPAALAGIMGGLLSAIEEDTTKLLLESANFDGVSVRRSATKLGMRTEASARYEKTLDPELTVPAIGRFLKLLIDIDGGVKVTSALTDEYRKKYDTIAIEFDKAYVDKYTGIDISSAQIEETLTLLGFEVVRENDNFKIVVPSWRATKDVTIKADIIEEITRIYGYDNFEIKSTKSLLMPVRQDKAREDEYSIKKMLADRFAFSEVHSYIWYDNKLNKELGIEADSDVKIVNSLTAENEAIRNTIIPALICFADKNLDGAKEVKMFEIGRVVRGFKEDGLCNERKVLSLLYVSREKNENELLAKVKEVADAIASDIKNSEFGYCTENKPAYKFTHAKNSATMYIDGKEAGYISVLTPKVASKLDKKVAAAMLEIDLGVFAEAEYKSVDFKELSKFPGINIDLSLLTDDNETFGKVSEIAKSINCEYLENISFVEIFKDASIPSGKKSMTIRLQFVSYERTLQGEEVNGFVQDILKKLGENEITLRQ